MEATGYKVDLNIYLLKVATDLANAIKQKGVNSEEVAMGGSSVGTLYTKPVHANPPRWAKFFKDVVKPGQFGKNTSTGALLAVPVEKRLFVLTFGQGRHFLESEFIEMDFGLRTTLNLVDEKSLRTIDKASFETHPRLSREQSGRASELQYFAVDVERDLLRALTGKPIDSSWGERISGMDSLKLSLETNVSALKSILSSLLKAYSDTSYRKKGFAFVDHIKEVRDPARQEELDELLIANIIASKTDRIWLNVPELVDWDKAVGFKYSQSPKSARVYDVRLDQFIETIEAKDLDKDLLLRRKIYCVDSEDVPIFERPAFYYIYAELAYEDSTYLLNSGKWYLVDEDFANEIIHYYKSIPRYKSVLPAFTHADRTEGRYNERVAAEAPAEFALLDQKNITIPGAVSAIEPCDLYRSTKEFIHVKRYGGSSLLSHHFNQGVVSSETFKRVPFFREEVNKRLPNPHKISNIKAPPKEGEYKVVFAIVSEHEEDLSIPFFSKITLRHAVTRLNEIGFPVELAKIPVDEIAKKVKVFPSKGKKRKAA